MILDLPITNELDAVRANRRVPAAVNETRRRSASSLPMSGSKYADVMNQVESDKVPTSTAELAPTKSTEISYWEKEEFGFGDLLDIVNPLQHIPIVATIYRHFTADKIGVVPRVIGGALWGRLGGFAAGLINAAVEWFTGKDVGDHIFTALWGERSTDSNQVTAQTDLEWVNDCNDTPLVSVENGAAPSQLSSGPLDAPTLGAQNPMAIVPADLTAAPQALLVPPAGSVALRQLQGINHWHDSLQLDAIATRARLRLSA